jgi:hypothetical protein
MNLTTLLHLAPRLLLSQAAPLFPPTYLRGIGRDIPVFWWKHMYLLNLKQAMNVVTRALERIIIFFQKLWPVLQIMYDYLP